MTDERSNRPRARETGAELAHKREMGVTAIVALMAKGDWETNGHIAFADEHGIAPATAANWAGEASRTLKALRRAAGLSDEDFRKLIVSRLERYAAMAEKRVGYTMAGDEYANPDLKSAIAATLGIAKVEGLEKGVQEQAEAYAAQWLGVIMSELAQALTPDEYAKVYAVVERIRLAKAGRLPVAMSVRVEKV